jgi:hypothetical protein
MMNQLAELVGEFDAVGALNGHLLHRHFDNRLELDGRWLVLRLDDRATPELPNPISGIWQIRYNELWARFDSVWTDSLGRIIVQTSDGWRDGALAFTGETVWQNEAVLVRDTFVRRDGELDFIVELRRAGGWQRLLEVRCRR